MVNETPPKRESDVAPKSNISRCIDLLFRLLLLALLAVNAFYLRRIDGIAKSLQTFSWTSQERLSQQAKAVPVFVINGIGVNQVEENGGNGNYVSSLPIRIDSGSAPVTVMSHLPLPVRIADQPVKVDVGVAPKQ